MTMRGMGPDWLARLTAARHAPAAGAVLLAGAAVGQAIAQATAHAHAVTHAQHAVPGVVAAVEYGIPLCVLALLATLPLFVVRPLAAALVIAAANTVTLAWFGTATVAGIAAQLLAGYRLGRQDENREPGLTGLAVAQPVAVALALPFAVLALTSHGGVAAVLLAAGAPAAAAAGISVRARRETRTRAAAGEALADTLTEHTARGERARIARELHDVVAHHISMVAVQAETARLTTPGLPAAGAQRFTEIGDTARAGLTEMRRLLGVLRDDAEDAGAAVADRHPQPGLPQLAELIDAAREVTASHATRLIVSGPVGRVRPGRRARRLPHRAGGADQRPAARPGRGRRRRGPLRRRPACTCAFATTGPACSVPVLPPAATACAACASVPWPSAARLQAGADAGGGFCVEADLPAKLEAG